MKMLVNLCKLPCPGCRVNSVHRVRYIQRSYSSEATAPSKPVSTLKKDPLHVLNGYDKFRVAVCRKPWKRMKDVPDELPRAQMYRYTHIYRIRINLYIMLFFAIVFFIKREIGIIERSIRDEEYIQSMGHETFGRFLGDGDKSK